MDPILSEIDKALKIRGLSDAAASKLAVGNYSLIKNMRTSRSEEKRYNVAALQKLADVLGLEFYFGPPRDSGPVENVTVDGVEFAQIPLHAAALAAGDGAENGAESVVDQLAFRRDWLRKIGVSASNAVLARASGDSMLPSIHPGDLLLIDTSRTNPPGGVRSPKDLRPVPIFAILDDGLARVKRVAFVEEGKIALLSDNPAHPPDFRSSRDVTIIGKVMWWGHTVRE
ncbi:S24 family peptidase [Acidimangrovimonas sediminis]|uniref:S24 family peptidase n=1 Tax=Acidimangrovimonas sediminis TaxID=2056283 RepID=UPI000C809906|nr:S24 family peptidase [Acidimangrovimonas sediminis]